MRAQNYLRKLGQYVAEHKRSKKPIIITVFTLINKTEPMRRIRESAAFQTFLSALKRAPGPHDIINRRAHFATRMRSLAQRAKNGPVKVFTTLHMLFRAGNAGWEYNLD